MNLSTSKFEFFSNVGSVEPKLFCGAGAEISNFVTQGSIRVFLGWFLLLNFSAHLMYHSLIHFCRVLEPTCFGAAPGIFYQEPAPGER